MKDAFGVERADMISKAETKAPPKASAGRQATGALLGPYHGLVAGKKGHKLRAAGNELAGGMAGGVAGGTAGAIPGIIARSPAAAAIGGQIGTTVGALAGKVAGTRRAQRMGHYKPEPTGVAKAEGTKWRLSEGERKAGQGNKKQKAAAIGAVGAYSAGVGAATYGTVAGAQDLASAKSERFWAKQARNMSLRRKGQMDAFRQSGNKKMAGESMRMALKHNANAVAGEKAARALSRSGKGKIALGAAAGVAGLGSLMAASNSQSNRVNAYRKSKGEAPRSKWTGFPKG